MRLPTFARQSDTTTQTDDRTPVGPRTDAGSSGSSQAPARPGAHAGTRPETRTDPRPEAGAAAVSADRARADRPVAQTRPLPPPSRPRAESGDETTVDMKRVPESDTRPAPAPVAAGPKPRASLLATLGLITGVGGALLVLSGPLAGYGIGVAGLALVLSLAGLRATRKRHVAGKTDALIGLVLALGAITLGVFALTGTLSWAGTDVQPVNNLREWLDAQFIERF